MRGKSAGNPKHMRSVALHRPGDPTCRHPINSVQATGIRGTEASTESLLPPRMCKTGSRLPVHIDFLQSGHRPLMIMKQGARGINGAATSNFALSGPPRK